MPNHAYTFAAAYVFFFRDDQILLSRRYDTGFEDGNYSLPAGHTEPGETFTDSAIRETAEEIGISLTPESIEVSHVMHRKTPEREYVDVFFTCKKWSGNPENREPKKCDDLSWFPINNLPKNIVPNVKHAIECSTKSIFYSEFGWNDNSL